LADGVQKKDSLMINGWQRLLGSDVDWSLLAGVGVGMTNVAVSKLSVDGTQIADASKWAPTVQVMAQFVKPFGKGLEAGIGYRYAHNFKEEFKSNTFDYKSFQHEFFARLSWRFGADTPRKVTPEPIPAPQPKPVVKPAPKPAPVAAPKPVAPPPLPAPFIVYFDFDEAAITGAAARTIADAARAFRTFKAIEIIATGHTDRAGSTNYNEALSQKRVEAVKTALVAEGVPSDKVIVKHEGENNPTVSTEDGVREYKNRRVEIKLVR
ncbi:MAG: OmpA family protein, partial [Kordiimonas sp.]